PRWLARSSLLLAFAGSAPRIASARIARDGSCLRRRSASRHPQRQVLPAYYPIAPAGRNLIRPSRPAGFLVLQAELGADIVRMGRTPALEKLRQFGVELLGQQHGQLDVLVAAFAGGLAARH